MSFFYGCDIAFYEKDRWGHEWRVLVLKHGLKYAIYKNEETIEEYTFSSNAESVCKLMINMTSLDVMGDIINALL